VILEAYWSVTSIVVIYYLTVESKIYGMYRCMRILWRALVADHETYLCNNNNACYQLSHATCLIDLI